MYAVVCDLRRVDWVVTLTVPFYASSAHVFACPRSSVVSGASILLDSGDRRATLSLYLLSRALHEFITLKATQKQFVWPEQTTIAMCVCFVELRCC
jgi:hypothetical protein